MNSYLMIRGIHPVGAGTFITELHCLKQVVVYDCGNGKGISKNDFHMIIDRAFEKVKHISLMFISHFDKDHVSGVEYLIEKGYLNRNSKVYLPLIQNKEIDLYYLFDSEFVYRDIIELLSNNEIPVIYVKPISNREEEDNNDENENTILSFRKIYLADKWLYIPFYLQDNSLLHTFAKYVAASPNPFTSQELENFAALSTSRRKELKKKYNAFKKGKAYGGITHINMNAMLLISKPIDENKNFYGVICRQKTYNNIKSKILITPSTLYTSDVGLNRPIFFNCLYDRAKQFLPEGIGLLQIPHHGSYKCYNKDIYKLNPDTIFANADTEITNPAFCADIVNDAYINNKSLYLIDKKSENLFKEIIINI